MSSNDQSKIQDDHRRRKAYVYVRQSSLHQVQNNTASTARQYNLVERAKELGWQDENIIVVDQDQGQSGSSLEGRDGFKLMLKDILMGNVGAVFSLEASRLARDSSDWHQLVKLCTIRNTLIIDELGIHNPRAFDDRLLLSIKGTLSDAELHLITSRLHGGLLQCAKEGKLRCQLPVGYVYDSTGSVILNPAPEVQQAVRLVFDQYDRLGSAAAVVRYFKANNLLIPGHYYKHSSDGKTKLVSLRHRRALDMVRNPTYAGMYVYGRSRRDIKIVSAENLQTITRRATLPAEEWAVIIRDAHEAYISEDRLWRNIQRIKDSRRLPSTPGVACRGSALLQGLVRCGVCGKRMVVKYSTSHSPHYWCPGERHVSGSGLCQFLAGKKVDAQITELVLEALAPAQLALSKITFKHVETEANAVRNQWKNQVIQAEKEAETAGLLFKHAAIQNRHVAAQLQNDWEESLKRLEELKQSERNLPDPPSRVAMERVLARLINLTESLRTVWDAPSTDIKDRKELVRLLITDVILIRKTDVIHVTVRWASGGRQELEIPWLSFPKSQASDAAIIELIKQMAPTHTDRAIADKLNSLGYRRRYGQQEFTAHSVMDIRKQRNIAHSCPQRYKPGMSGPRGDGRYCVREVAEMVGCCKVVISDLCKAGKLDALRSTDKSPWWVKIDENQIRELAEEIRLNRKRPVQPRKWAKGHISARRRGGQNET